MTVWNRIDIEYVRMESALEIALDQVQAHFDLAFAQLDISLKRIATGLNDRPHMGESEDAAEFMCDLLATRSPGEFSMEGKPGWFFVAAANRHRPEKHEWVIYEGNAFAQGSWIRLPRSSRRARAGA